MEIFRYREDRLPAFLIVLYFLVDLTVYFLADSLWFVIAWMLIGIFPKTCVCAFGHHHQHLPTFRQSWLNRLYEVVLGFHTGITSHAWFLHHVVGHHRHYLDQEQDESGWQRKDGTKMHWLEYAFVIAGTGYWRAYKVGKDYPKQRRIFVSMLLLQIGLLGLLFWHHWVNALFIFLIPMAISLFITAWHTYYHHAGLETTDHEHACNNIYHKWYNVLTGNLGYHTAHHARGSVHWSRLPEFHEKKFADKIPPENVHEPCFPFKWMPSGDEAEA